MPAQDTRSMDRHMRNSLKKDSLIKINELKSHLMLNMKLFVNDPLKLHLCKIGLDVKLTPFAHLKLINKPPYEDSRKRQ